MTFQGCMSVADVKTVEAKGNYKAKRILRLSEPSRFGRQSELSEVDVTVYDGQARLLDNIGPGCRVFIMGHVSGRVNDKGFCNLTLAADRIELLAGASGQVAGPLAPAPRQVSAAPPPTAAQPAPTADLPPPPAEEPALPF